MLLFKTLKSQFHLNERSDLITCTPNTTNPNNFNKLLLRLFIVSDGHLQNQLSFFCFITCTCRFFQRRPIHLEKKNTEYHPNYPHVFYFQRLLVKGAKKSNSNVPTKVVGSAKCWLITSYLSSLYKNLCRHPWRLTWNIIMEVWFRSFSFLFMGDLQVGSRR